MPPWLLLILLLSLAFALGYQLVVKRYGKRIFGYWVLTFLALMGGEAAAEIMGWNVLRYGDLRLLADLAGGGVAVLVLGALRI